MQGGAGNDLLIGNKGLDTLHSRTGDDRTNAGRNGNTIVYRPDDSGDRVFDFVVDDKLDLKAFDFDWLIDILIHARETDHGKAFLISVMAMSSNSLAFPANSWTTVISSSRQSLNGVGWGGGHPMIC